MVTSADGRGKARPRGITGAHDPVLLSKITVPRIPGWAVPRPRVDQLIADGTRGPLTTVTGPPGAGKTMAIALWAAANNSRRTLVWITLDNYDNRPKVFWSYVVAALRRARIALPRALPASARGTAVDHTFLLRLASVLAVQDPPVIMVLDDVHLLTAPETLDGLAYVLRNGSPGLHLVMASRMDPLIPLHRYRLAGELAEIRAEDLAFSAAESNSLLAHHGIALSSEALARLNGRTEGWAAGVRLAALSLDGRPDPEQFIKELDAEESAVTSYLVDEVLNAQPPVVRNMLLRTSILDNVNADLAAELTTYQQAGDALPALARANAFVRPLGHGWFRYHSMFGAVLRLKLRSESPDLVSDLHRRAARWYQRNGFLDMAVHHAARAGDWHVAAGMILDEFALDQLLEPRGNRSLAETFRSMPQEVARTRPQPLLVLAAMELASTPGDPGDATVAAAENMLERLPVGDEIPARLAAAMIRMAQSRRTGDPGAASVAAANAAALLEELPESLRARHPGVRAHVLTGQGAAELLANRLDEAAAAFRAAAATVTAPDSLYQRADSLGYLALVEALGGKLGRATKLAEEAAEATEFSDGIAWRVTPAANVALAAVHVYRNEMPQADRQLRLAEANLQVSPDKVVTAAACLIVGLRRVAEGHPAATAEIIAQARMGWSPPGWLQQRLTLLESRACADCGDVPAAVDAALRADPPSTADAAFALAHAWLAGGDHQAAKRAMATVAQGNGAAPALGQIDRWLLDARISYAAHDAARGRRSLESALRLAEPEQVRLPFAMKRTWIRHVLRRDPDLARAYRELLEPRLPQAPATDPLLTDRAAPLVIERLTEREHEVLRRLSGMLSTAEIAAEMYISVNTVKTHLRSIYRKLSVANRNEAVRCARQLGLI
jgi:LuxR family transcriptional regulator, maltose regulon positive regulatory protein